jgi:hypothetical protein
MDPTNINITVRLEDQFDKLVGSPEFTESIKPLYFLTPASKNNEKMYDSVTHYVAYEILPKRYFQYPANTFDQFGPHEITTINSELLLVPTKKISVGQPYDTVSVSFNTGWNMISIPLVVPDYRKIILFPSAISGAFAYEGVYVEKDTLENGVGYWLKFSSSGLYKLNGDAIDNLTISVTDGWNLIGSITDPVPTSSISSIPGGIITSQFFEYTTAYQSADTIKPGVGYWVKVNQAGQLVLSGAMATPSNRIRIVPTSEYPPLPPDQGTVGVQTRPIEYSLSQNYPNPFNPSTLIKFDLPEEAIVKLTVYNTLGQTVAVLLNGEKLTAGSQIIQLDASSLPSGVYYYRLVASGKDGDNFVSIKKMLILK